jgi:hypothetical protein
MSERQVEVLVFDGCPNVDATLASARAAVQSENVRANVRLVRVGSDEEARHLRFLGSPTVRVDGVDVDGTAERRDDYGLQCRLYTVGGRLQGAPPADWIASALRGEAAHPADSSPPTSCACGEGKPR